MGPTGVGKTSAAIELAERFNGEIISVDSMQVYRHMDIGTAKATAHQQDRVAHHLIDVVNPDEMYHAASFVRDCSAAIDAIHRRGALPILAGGTGLYLRAIRFGLFEEGASDPALRSGLQEDIRRLGSAALHGRLAKIDHDAAESIHPNDTSRIIRALEIVELTGASIRVHHDRHKGCTDTRILSNFLCCALSCERTILYERINQRTGKMMEDGLEDEVRHLLDMGYGPELKSMQALGYRHMVYHISGRWDMDKTIELLARDTRHYAKRQFTWFNKEPDVRWYDRTDRDGLIGAVESFLAKNN
jgi:tRNA dimethylallyltransferase